MEPVIKQAAVCPLTLVLQSEFFIALGTQDSEAISAFPLSVWQHKVAVVVVDNTYWGSELFLRMHPVLQLYSTGKKDNIMLCLSALENL